MHLQESGEMYLETILILSKERVSVRSIDVAEQMGFSKPSVSRAISLLKQGGFVTVSAEGFLALTETGLEIAQKIHDRHTLLTSFLITIGVEPEIAAKDACKIEHGISDPSFEALQKHIEKTLQNS